MFVFVLSTQRRQNDNTYPCNLHCQKIVLIFIKSSAPAATNAIYLGVNGLKFSNLLNQVKIMSIF